MTTGAAGKRRRTYLWFGVYTTVVLVVFGASLVQHQWSVAVTALMIATVFALFTRWLWRRR